MDPSAHGDYGAPENVSVSVNVSAGQLEIGVVALDKTPTRLPEAAFVSFEPAGAGNWSHEVLGGVVSLLRLCLVRRNLPRLRALVVMQVPAAVVPHGSSHLHAAEAMRWAGSGGGSLRVASLDAGLLCYGEPTAFPTPFAPADLSYGASWNLWNNIWGTNYPQWYPFDPKDSNIEYRFSVKYDA